MTAGSTLAQKIYEQAQALPEESLLELARDVEFLKFKARKSTRKSAPKERPLSTQQIVHLEGLLDGYDFSPELLAEARREMWQNFGNIEL